MPCPRCSTTFILTTCAISPWRLAHTACFSLLESYSPSSAKLTLCIPPSSAVGAVRHRPDDVRHRFNGSAQAAAPGVRGGAEQRPGEIQGEAPQRQGEEESQASGGG